MRFIKRVMSRWLRHTAYLIDKGRPWELNPPKRGFTHNERRRRALDLLTWWPMRQRYYRVLRALRTVPVLGWIVPKPPSWAFLTFEGAFAEWHREQEEMRIAEAKGNW